MLFDIEVRHNGNGDYFQPYKEVGVEALTSQDAVAKIQRQNPGCQVWCCNSYNAPRSKSSSSSDIGDTAGWFYLAIIIFLLYVLSKWWMIVLPMAVLIGIFWLHDKFK